MEVLRVPPYPITTKWDVPNASTVYTYALEDVVDHSIETGTLTSDSNSQVTYTLPRSKVQYDRDFAFRVYDNYGEIVLDDNLTVYRPYVDFTQMGLTEPEQKEYKKWEIIGRSIIDAYLGNDSATGEGFYNHKLIVQGVGEGNDYFPMWHNPKRILKVYENNILVYNGEDSPISITTSTISGNNVTFTTSTSHEYSIGDNITLSGFAPDAYNITVTITDVPNTSQFSFILSNAQTITQYGIGLRIWLNRYVISPNNSAITRVETGLYNRYEQTPLRLPIAYGDVGPYGLVSGNGVAFPRGYDYTFILDVGYKAVPPDVEQAAIMLIDDLMCDRNPYYKRFVTQYDTDQYSIKYSKAFLEGTGNNIVDKILDGYRGDVIKPGIL